MCRCWWKRRIELTHRASRLLPASARRLCGTIVLLSLALAAASPSYAQPARKWTQAAEMDFEAGKRENVALTSIGELKLARLKDTMLDKAGDHVWALALDAKGTVYAATGSSGEIYKIAGGKSELFYKSEELEILCLEFDRAGNLYAGTAPNGLIYKFNPAGQMELYLDSEETYIWGMAFNRKGVLYAASGDRGRLLKVAEKGKAEIVFESKENHLLDVVADSKDNMYVCTSKSGLVFRIDPAGKAFAVLDCDDDEMHALAVDEADNIYVCTADGMQPGTAGLEPPSGTGVLPPDFPPGPPAAKETDDGDVDGDDIEPPDNLPAQPLAPGHVPAGPPRNQSSIAPPINGINFVYRITPDGLVTSLIRREGMAMMSMVCHGGRIYLGTSNQGQILMIDENLQETLISQVEQPHVTAMAAAPDGTLYFGTAAEARVYRLAGNVAKEGTFTSMVKDMSYPSQWGKLRWTGDQPDGTSIAVSTRSGNIAEPDNTWSEWTPERAGIDGVNITSPIGRFLQYRLRLKTNNESKTPLVRMVEAYYLPPNYRPKVMRVSLPGASQSAPSEPGPSMPQGPPAEQSVLQASSAGAPLRGQVEINWQAEDPNGDQMRFELFFRGADESSWKSVADKLTETRYIWNTVRVPDGIYRLKVKADDEPSNPPARALASELVSEPFRIDNTPPNVELKTRIEADGKVLVTATLSDAASPIDDAAYSVDSGAWVLLTPDDGIFDSQKENVTFRTESLKPGEHTIVVNVRDGAGNVGAGKAVVVLPEK